MLHLISTSLTCNPGKQQGGVRLFPKRDKSSSGAQNVYEVPGNAAGRTDVSMPTRRGVLCCFCVTTTVLHSSLLDVCSKPLSLTPFFHKLHICRFMICVQPSCSSLRRRRNSGMSSSPSCLITQVSLFSFINDLPFATRQRQDGWTDEISGQSGMMKKMRGMYVVGSFRQQYCGDAKVMEEPRCASRYPDIGIRYTHTVVL